MSLRLITDSSTHFCPLQYHLISDCCSFIKVMNSEQEECDCKSEVAILSLGPPIFINSFRVSFTQFNIKSSVFADATLRILVGGNQNTRRHNPKDRNLEWGTKSLKHDRGVLEITLICYYLVLMNGTRKKKKMSSFHICMKMLEYLYNSMPPMCFASGPSKHFICSTRTF